MKVIVLVAVGICMSCTPMDHSMLLLQTETTGRDAVQYIMHMESGETSSTYATVAISEYRMARTLVGTAYCYGPYASLICAGFAGDGQNEWIVFEYDLLRIHNRVVAQLGGRLEVPMWHKSSSAIIHGNVGVGLNF